MSHYRLVRIAVIALVASVGIIAAGGPAFAANETPTATEFESTKPITVPFGSDWLVEVKIKPDLDGDFIPLLVGPEDGTVAFRVSGQPETFANDSAVFPGGVAYFTQPDDQPLLAPGTYGITAIFNPMAGGDFATSKSRSSAQIVITSLGLTPEFDVINDPSVSDVPLVRTTIGGEFVSETGAPPAGVWEVSVVDPSGEEVFRTQTEQPTTSDSGEVGPLDIPIPGKLKANSTFDVRAVFTPEKSLAPGLEFSEPSTVSFSTAPPTLAERLAVPVPLWVLVIAAGAIVAATVMVIILLVKRAKSAGPRPPRAPKRAATPKVVAAASAELEVSSGDSSESPAAIGTALAIESPLATEGPIATERPLATEGPSATERTNAGESKTPPKETWEIRDIFADETAPNEVPSDRQW